MRTVRCALLGLLLSLSPGVTAEYPWEEEPASHWTRDFSHSARDSRVPLPTTQLEQEGIGEKVTVHDVFDRWVLNESVHVGRGTHFAEVELWKAAGVDLTKDKGPWYKETGSGMGPTLNTASGMNAYALADRGTWLSFKNRGELVISVEGDRRLFNQYGVMLVNPAKHPHVKKEMGQAFIDWLISDQGQDAVAAYKIGGEQLFFPNAKG